MKWMVLLFTPLMLVGCGGKKNAGMVFICTATKFNVYHNNKKCPTLLKCEKDILLVPYSERHQNHKDYNNRSIERVECGLCYSE